MFILISFLIFVFILTVFGLLYFLFKKDKDPKKSTTDLEEITEEAEVMKEETDINNQTVYDNSTQYILNNGFTDDDIKKLTEKQTPCIFYPTQRVYVEEKTESSTTVKVNIDEKDPDSITEGSLFKTEGSCPNGMEFNTQTGCCNWEAVNLSDLDKIMAVAPKIVEMIIVTVIFEKMVIVMRKLFPMSYKAKLVKVQSKMGKVGKTLGKFSRKATFETGEKLAMRGGSTVMKAGSKRFAGKMSIKGAGLALKQGVKTAARSTLKAGSSVATKLMAPLAPCGPCTAAVIAFELVSAALDISDIHNYGTYTANSDIRNIRNQAETSMEQYLYDSDGVSWPQLFPILTAFPDLNEPSKCPNDNLNCRDPENPSETPEPAETEEPEETRDVGDSPDFNPAEEDEYKIPEINDGYSAVLMEAFTASAMEKMALEDPNGFVEMLVYAFTSDDDDEVEISDATSTMFAEILQAEIDYNHIKRDKIIYNLCVSRGYGDQVEFIESMSSETVIGVTLNEEGARLYNERMAPEHLKYSNPASKVDKDDIPDEYVALVAAYTDSYRRIDKLNPGTSQSPNVIEEKLPRKMTLMMPWAALMYNCLGDDRGTSASYFTINPSDHGVTFNYDKGHCDYTKEYCVDKMKLDYRNGDCHLSKSQRVAEMIFGETVTRSVKGSWDKRKDDFNSGDPARIIGAMAQTYFDPTGLWTSAYMDIKNLIEASKGRGVGVIPTKCRDNEEKKGALCYPKCRPGYRSRALECEGSCPPGSKNTGLTCIQGTKTKSCFAWEKTSRCEKRFKDADGNPIGKRSKGASTVAKPCLPGFKRRSYALGTAFCDKPRPRYTRAFMAKIKSKCPDSHPNKQNGLCYKDCPEGYPRARGPICMKRKESGTPNN